MNLGKNFTATPNQTHTHYLLHSSHLVISPSLFSLRGHYTRDDTQVMSPATPTVPATKVPVVAKLGRAREQLLLSWWHTRTGTAIWCPILLLTLQQKLSSSTSCLCCIQLQQENDVCLGDWEEQSFREKQLLFPMLPSQGSFHSSKGDQQGSRGLFYRLTDV